MIQLFRYSMHLNGWKLLLGIWSWTHLELYLFPRKPTQKPNRIITSNYSIFFNPIAPAHQHDTKPTSYLKLNNSFSV